MGFVIPRFYLKLPTPGVLLIIAKPHKTAFNGIINNKKTIKKWKIKF